MAANTRHLDAVFEINVWSQVELGISIVAGNLATLHPLFRILHNRSTRVPDPEAPGEVATIGGGGMPRRLPFLSSLNSMRRAHVMLGPRRSGLHSVALTDTVTT